MNRRYFLKLSGTSFVTLGFGTCRKITKISKQPNIILIMADDLGWQELGCYGQKKIKTPHIDKLAAEGMRFMQFYAGSAVCAPSRCNLMTGKHGGHAYIRNNLSVKSGIKGIFGGQFPLPRGESGIARCNLCKYFTT